MSLLARYFQILHYVLSVQLVQKDALVFILFMIMILLPNSPIICYISFSWNLSSTLLLSYLMIADANLTTFLLTSFEYLMRRQQQQAQEMQPQRVVDLVKRLEESLFKSASTKVYCCFSFVYYLV